MKLILTPILSTLLLQQCSAFTIIPASSVPSSRIVVQQHHHNHVKLNNAASSSEESTTPTSTPSPTPTPVVEVKEEKAENDTKEAEPSKVAVEDDDDDEEEEMSLSEIMKIPVIQRLSETEVTSVKTNTQINLASYLQSANDKSMLIFGTYAADFNAIEYVQRVRYYKSQLNAKGVDKIGLILNCEKDAAVSLVQMLDLDTDATSGEDGTTVVELFIDPTGEAGRNFGVGKGWRPDDAEMSPYVKLFGMLFGLGAIGTLPAVIGGYTGNPFFSQDWIEDALAVGQVNGRWPKALDMDEAKGTVITNNFKELPVVGGWKRRPLELATLRLQNMVDISIKNWSDLAPKEDALKAGVLTQLGGCVVVDSKSGDEITRWRDPGICAVANFEDLLKNI